MAIFQISISLLCHNKNVTLLIPYWQSRASFISRSDTVQLAWMNYSACNISPVESLLTLRTRGAEGAATPLPQDRLKIPLCPSIIPNIAYMIFVIVLWFNINWPEICGCIFLASLAAHVPHPYISPSLNFMWNVHKINFRFRLVKNIYVFVLFMSRLPKLSRFSRQPPTITKAQLFSL